MPVSSHKSSQEPNPGQPPESRPKARRQKIPIAPLSHERLAILLALAAGPAPGARVAVTIAGDSWGNIYLKKSSLYRLLHELEVQGYITLQPVNLPGSKYDLTPKGWRALENELPRVKHLAQLLEIRLSPRQYRANLTPGIPFKAPN